MLMTLSFGKVTSGRGGRFVGRANPAPTAIFGDNCSTILLTSVRRSVFRFYLQICFDTQQKYISHLKTEIENLREEIVFLHNLLKNKE
jgi:hypothetical protein